LIPSPPGARLAEHMFVKAPRRWGEGDTARWI
jgi:hypothetical protein